MLCRIVPYPCMGCAGTPDLRQYIWYILSAVPLTMLIVFGVWFVLSLWYEARKQLKLAAEQQQQANAAAEAADGGEEGLLEPLIGESAGSQTV